MKQKRKTIFYHLLIFNLCFTVSGCGDEDLYWGPLDFYGHEISYDDKNADIHIGIAAVAFVSDYEPEISRDKMADMIYDITSSNPEVKVIVFPETSLSFYWEKNDTNGEKTKENNERIAETVPGISTDFVGQISTELNIYVVFGMVEKENEKLYNSLVVVNPEGNVEAIHRKTFLLDSDKTAGFSPGDGVTFVEIEEVKIALLICHDSESVDFAEKIVKGKAKIVIQALADERGESFISFDRGYGKLWNTWTVYANKAGTEGDYWMENNSLDFAGLVGIAKPMGEIAAKKEYSDGGYVYYNVGVYK